MTFIRARTAQRLAALAGLRRRCRTYLVGRWKRRDEHVVKRGDALRPPARHDEAFKFGCGVFDMPLQQAGRRPHLADLAQAHKFGVLFLGAPAALDAQGQLQARVAVGLQQQARDDGHGARLLRARHQQVVQPRVQFAPAGRMLRV